MPTGTKGCSNETEVSFQSVGRPQSQPSGPHAALESLDQLRLYQAKVVAALETKEYGETYEWVQSPGVHEDNE